MPPKKKTGGRKQKGSGISLNALRDQGASKDDREAHDAKGRLRRNHLMDPYIPKITAPVFVPRPNPAATPISKVLLEPTSDWKNTLQVTPKTYSNPYDDPYNKTVRKNLIEVMNGTGRSGGTKTIRGVLTHYLTPNSSSYGGIKF